MIERSVYQYLIEWKSKEDRKPLILRGARQVGKSTLVSQFSKEYKQKVMLNLEKPEHQKFFDQYETLDQIVEAIFLSHNIDPARSPTLLFLDEIQEAPKAIWLLRYFYEEYPYIHVIAAGSLLEFAMGEVKSFPVGRVEYLYLSPLTFSEFLLAMDKDLIFKKWNKIPLNSVAHETLLNLFHTFIMVGGMPEIVRNYKASNTLLSLRQNYESIWATYKEDVEKYGQNDTERKVIKHIMATAPPKIDERIKFQHFGNSNYRSREVGEALRALDAALVIRLVYPTTDLDPPLRNDFKRAPKLQFLDTGLLNYALGIHPELLRLKDFNEAYRGAIVPHMVFQELIGKNYFQSIIPSFWVREKTQSSSEVDLVIQYQGKVIPIEIKSGSSGSMRSLIQFMDLCSHHLAIRLYAGSLRLEKTKTIKGKPFFLLHLPYFLIAKIEEYLAWMEEEIEKGNFEEK